MPVACPNCTYDLTSPHWASDHVRCPECGFDWTAEELDAHAKKQPFARALAAMVVPTALITLFAVSVGALTTVVSALGTVEILALLAATVVGVSAPFVIAARRSHPAELRGIRFTDEAVTGLTVNIGILAVAYFVVFTLL